MIGLFGVRCSSLRPAALLEVGEWGSGHGSAVGSTSTTRGGEVVGISWLRAPKRNSV